MKNVIILGGIGTKKTHIKNLIKLYKNLNLNPIFYQANGILGNHLYKPDKFKIKTLKIIEDLDYKKKPYIIHSFSGSNWLAYDINSHLPAETIILESAPIKPCYYSFNNFLNLNYNIKIPLSILQGFMNILKIPTNSNDNFNQWYNLNKPKNNTLILIGENDKLLNQNYIKKEYIDINEINNNINTTNKLDNKLVIFNNCGHCNIYKHNNDLYNKTITEWLEQNKI